MRRLSDDARRIVARVGLERTARRRSDDHHVSLLEQADLGKMFSAMGAPVTDPNAVPSPGDYFISTDNAYIGDHRKHAKAVYATDHIICTFVTIDPATQTFKALCGMPSSPCLEAWSSPTIRPSPSAPTDSSSPSPGAQAGTRGSRAEAR